MRILKILSFALMLGACATTPEARQKKMEEKIRMAACIHDQIVDMNFRINVSMMYPLRYPPRVVTSPYYLEVIGDSVVSYLPYMGQAYNVPYGGGKALNFVGKVINSKVWREKQDKYLMVLDIDNEEALYRYSITTFDNGSSTIDVDTRERERISFSGTMECVTQ